MNTIQSLRLIYELYYKKGLPDLNLIQSYGLLAVKIGQIHALRLDFLSAEKCEHLSKLYRQNNAIPIEILDEELKSKFSYFDEKPLAVASVGQVYRARLKTGEEVVVKIVKDKFKKQFVKDVKKIRSFFKLVLFLNPKLKSVGNPLGILDDIEEYTLTELNLKNEIIGQKTLKDIYDNNKDKFDLSVLKFNKIYADLSNENILVSEYIPSKTIDELLEGNNFSYKDMINFFRIQGFYIFFMGKFHGDIHPGNILFNGREFYFIDNSFIGIVGDKIRKGLCTFFYYLSRYDYKGCAKGLNSMSEIELIGDEYNIFESKMLDLYKDFTNKTVSEVSLTKQMMLTIKLGVNSGMKFEKGMFAVIRSMMYLDGMVLKCNPNAILMNDMRDYIDQNPDYFIN